MARSADESLRYMHEHVAISLSHAGRDVQGWVKRYGPKRKEQCSLAHCRFGRRRHTEKGRPGHGAPEDIFFPSYLLLSHSWQPQNCCSSSCPRDRVPRLHAAGQRTQAVLEARTARTRARLYGDFGSPEHSLQAGIIGLGCSRRPLHGPHARACRISSACASTAVNGWASRSAYFYACDC